MARTLLLLARYGKTRRPANDPSEDIPRGAGGKLVGDSTRSRGNLFMNKFKKLGFIDYKRNYSGGIQVHNSLLQPSRVMNEI